MDRRAFLVTTAALATPFVAGCAGRDGGGEDSPESTPGSTSTESPTSTTMATESQTSTATKTPTETPPSTETATRTETPTATATPDQGVEGADTTIEAVDISFDPLRASVGVGTTVGWVNRDGVAHTVTSARFHEKARSWEKDVQIGSGETTTHTFEEAGVYEYYCKIHGRETQCGAVLVGDVTLEEDLPCES